VFVLRTEGSGGRATTAGRSASITSIAGWGSIPGLPVGSEAMRVIGCPSASWPKVIDADPWHSEDEHLLLGDLLSQLAGSAGVLAGVRDPGCAGAHVLRDERHP
jgi:hypothetical protein